MVLKGGDRVPSRLEVELNYDAKVCDLGPLL